MYQRQFGLDHNPFTSAAVGDQVYTGIRQGKAVAKLKIALSKPDAVVAVVGPIGVGKSTLALKAVDAAAEQALTAIVAPLNLSQDDVLELLIAEFGINSEASSNMARFQDLRCFFTEQTQEGYRPFVLIEDAAALGIENLQMLDALTAADPRGYSGANLILLGGPELSDLLASAPLARLKQRLRAEQAIERFSVEETGDYLYHRLAQAGANAQDIVDGNVAQAVHQSTQGVARLIDNLMDTALSFAFSRKQARLLPAMVQKVARSVYGFDTGEPVDAATTDEPAEHAGSVDTPAAEAIDSIDEPAELPVDAMDSETSPGSAATPDGMVAEPATAADAVQSEIAAPAPTLFDAPAAELHEPTVDSAMSPPADGGLAAPLLATFETPDAAPAEMQTGPMDVEEAVAMPAEAAVETAPPEALQSGNEIPVLEDAIDLALMEDDAPAIGNALAIEMSPAEPDEQPSTAPADIDPAPPAEATATDGNGAPSDGATSGSFEDWAANVAKAASLEELDAQIAETLFGTPELDSLGAEINVERRAAKPLEEREEDSGGIVPNNVVGGGLG